MPIRLGNSPGASWGIFEFEAIQRKLYLSAGALIRSSLPVTAAWSLAHGVSALPIPIFCARSCA